MILKEENLPYCINDEWIKWLIFCWMPASAGTTGRDRYDEERPARRGETGMTRRDPHDRERTARQGENGTTERDRYDGGEKWHT